MLKEIDQNMRVLESLRQPNGLFLAAPCQETGYGRAVWIRDNIYSSLGFGASGRRKAVKVIQGIFDILKRHEYKIDHAIGERPAHAYQYIHARYHPETLEEFWDEWGNKQNDAVGAFLFMTGKLIRKGLCVIRDAGDLRVLNKLVWYLNSIRYWEDDDHGFWEKEEELHASSVGACLAGLEAISAFVHVPKHMIRKGRETLERLLPRESESKETDLALLSLIYPYDIVTPEQRDAILKDVEAKLVRERGVIRHFGDYYYNRDGEAEWTMGLPWLAIIYRQLGNMPRYRHYMRKARKAMNPRGELPELYFAGTADFNENTPLGMSQALYLAALSGTIESNS